MQKTLLENTQLHMTATHSAAAIAGTTAHAATGTTVMAVTHAV